MAAISRDTTPMDLGSLKSDIPAAVPDTFTRPQPPQPVAEVPHGPRPAPAPEALMQAVKREQSFSKFCYQEFGQKSDPSLSGGVAMIVTVGESGITDAFVLDDSWSSHAGQSVNGCLDQKAAKAWKAAAGVIKPGKYVVQLRFRPS